MEERSRISYFCKSCNSLFFSESEVMTHKAMTGHQRFEKRGGQEGDHARDDLYRQLEDMGVSTRKLDSLPTGALNELVESLRKARKTYNDTA